MSNPLRTNGGWQQRFTIKTGAGVAVNLTGMTLRSQFRVAAGMPLLADCSTTNGKIVIVDATNGVFDILLTPTDCAGFPPGNVEFDVLWTNSTNGNVPLMAGRIPVKQGITITS